MQSGNVYSNLQEPSFIFLHLPSLKWQFEHCDSLKLSLWLTGRTWTTNYRSITWSYSPLTPFTPTFPRSLFLPYLVLSAERWPVAVSQQHHVRISEAPHRWWAPQFTCFLPCSFRHYRRGKPPHCRRLTPLHSDKQFTSTGYHCLIQCTGLVRTDHTAHIEYISLLLSFLPSWLKHKRLPRLLILTLEWIYVVSNYMHGNVEVEYKMLDDTNVSSFAKFAIRINWFTKTRQSFGFRIRSSSSSTSQFLISSRIAGGKFNNVEIFELLSLLIIHY